MSSLIVDVVLVLFIALALIRGYQRGLIVSFLGLVGFLGGAIAGLAFGPSVVDTLPAIPRILALIVILLTLANLGQSVTMAIARAVRQRLLWKPLRMLDSTAGATFTILGTVLLLWATAAVLRVSPYQSMTVAVADSRVVSAIDQFVPDLARSAIAKARQVVNDGNFPNVFSALGPEPYFDALPPDQEVLNTPAIAEASRSVARITGVAVSCRRAVEGSGFVIGDGLVMTNAHVIAGVSNPRVRINGASNDAIGKVVYFDPEKDVAIIQVPRLTAKALEVREVAGRGDDAVVAGFPENGPFTLGAARIKGEITAIGWDIYSKERVRRDVYAVAAEVRPGNSGGPLLAADGQLVGMIFARSTTDEETGYALTMKEIRFALKSLGSSRSEASTGRCA
jgi:S1-C subfamily serine protease